MASARSHASRSPIVMLCLSSPASWVGREKVRCTVSGNETTKTVLGVLLKNANVPNRPSRSYSTRTKQRHHPKRLCLPCLSHPKIRQDKMPSFGAAQRCFALSHRKKKNPASLHVHTCCATESLDLSSAGARKRVSRNLLTPNTTSHRRHPMYRTPENAEERTSKIHEHGYRK